MKLPMFIQASWGTLRDFCVRYEASSQAYEAFFTLYLQYQRPRHSSSWVEKFSVTPFSQLS